MKKVDIKIEKTARYFILGKPSSKITNLWFVCHGYGQLANYFLKWFETIQNENTLIVAPEGLSRFYWNGFSGSVVASWMTKEERDADIDDSIGFLDKVAKEVLNDLKNVKINVLGFSQGASTATRWVTYGKTQPDKLILWAGSFPEDIDYKENIDTFSKLDLHILIGDKDELFSEEVIQKKLSELKKRGVNYQLHRFEGGHKILPIPLSKLQKEFSI